MFTYVQCKLYVNNSYHPDSSMFFSSDNQKTVNNVHHQHRFSDQSLHSDVFTQSDLIFNIIYAACEENKGMFSRSI